MTDLASPSVLASCLAEYRRYKSIADRAIAHLPEPLLRQPPSRETNSIAVIVKHLAGNMLSRFTDFLTTDGEKAWRDRDSEFIDDFASRDAILARWEQGWACLFGALAELREEDLAKIVPIRGEPHSVVMALTRSLAHAAYHTGQIVQTARALAEREGIPWNTITVPRGGSGAFNLSKGYTPEAAPRSAAP